MRKLSRSQFLFAALVCMAVFGMHAARADAATFSFSTSSAVVHEGQEIAVDVMVDPQGEDLNTLSATISIPSNLTFVNSDDSSSVVSLWVDQPTYDPATGTFTLSGIIPGGFSGLIDPFQPGSAKSSGTLIRLYLKGSTVGPGTLSFTSAAAYLNNTLGEDTNISTEPLSIVTDSLLGGTSVTIPASTTPPLPFTPILERDVLLYDGQYVVIFNTEDKVSGMDHYEVREGNGPWIVAVSPYLLKDQTVSGPITIKAVDRAGNIREETIPALHHVSLREILEVSAGVLVLLILLVAYLVFKARQRRKARVLAEAEILAQK